MARGRNAESLLRNDTLQGVFKELELGLWGKFRASRLNDTETREYCWTAINLLDEVSKRLQSYVNEAALHRKTEEQRKQSAEAKGSYFR